MTCTVETDVIDPKTAIWQMNKATNNHLKSKFGDETKNWIGKEIEIVVKQVGNMNPSVYPVDCSLEFSSYFSTIFLVPSSLYFLSSSSVGTLAMSPNFIWDFPVL